MKKLLALGAFILMGSMVFAQTPSKQKSASAAPASTMQVASPVAEAAVTPDEAVVSKKEAKKDCSDADKKQCGSKTSGKKSCCSSKAEATKEDAK